MPETTASRNDLSRAIRQLDMLEDYCDMFDRLVDRSDISSVGDENSGPAAGLPDADLAASRAFLYASATSTAYINETEFRWIRARSRAVSLRQSLRRRRGPQSRGLCRRQRAYV